MQGWKQKITKLVIFVCMLGGSAMLAATHSRTNNVAPMPKGLWQAFSEARHQIESVKDPQKEGYFYKAYNPKMHYTIHFGQKGIKLKNKAGELSMKLVGYGSQSHITPVSNALFKNQGKRIDFQHARLSEWYINDPQKGLEQGFTLQKPKGYDRKQSIVLSLEIDGSFHPRVLSDTAIAFYNGKEKIFDYKGLKAFDAKGQNLPVHLTLRRKTLHLVINTANAKWPVMVDPFFESVQKVIPQVDISPAGEYDVFGWTISLHEDTALIGAVRENQNNGSVYVMVHTETGWVIQTKLTDPDAYMFGKSISFDGRTALIGAKNAVYVFTHYGIDWYLQTILTPADGPHDSFGQAVSLSGNFALIGSCNYAAYIYMRLPNDTWEHRAWWIGPEDSAFGCSVSLDGNTALIGAGDDDNIIGSAYIYTKSSNGTWSQAQKIVATDRDVGDRFGWAVSLDGDTALIGAYGAGAAYIFTRSNTTWSQQAKLSPLDGAGKEFGTAVSLKGNTALIGAPLDDVDNHYDSGSAYLFSRLDDGTWQQKKKITSSTLIDHSEFGIALSLDNSRAIIGARDTDINRGGAIYVFDSTWQERAKITKSDRLTNYKFGYAVSIDDDTALIGAPYDMGSGTVYVFTHSEDQWDFQKTLTSPDADINDLFGSAISLNGDTALIGACGDDNKKGSAYIFKRSGTHWSKLVKLTSSDGEEGDNFGYTVSFDNNTALIGAYGDENKMGSAYAYTYVNDEWHEEKLVATDGENHDHFGYAVSLDGDQALIGADGSDDNGAINNGAAYIFVRMNGGWEEKAKLIASDADDYIGFGSAVSLSSNTALIGAYGDDNNGSESGSAYIFTASRNGAWRQWSKLTASDPAEGDRFGYTVSLDGTTAIVGAPYKNDNGTNSGSVYIFTRLESKWNQTTKLRGPDTSEGDNFGKSISLDNNTLLVGAPYNDDNGSESGSAYFFKLPTDSSNSTNFVPIITYLLGS